MRKLLIIALVAVGFIIAAVPESDAHVSIAIGFGFPGYFAYPAYYPPVYPVPYYGSVYYSVGYRPYYWWHGRRFYRRYYWR